MTQFTELNSSSFNLNEKQSVTPNSQLKLCVCCLSGDVLLIKLDSCKHASFLFTLFENKVDLTSAFVCYQCHNIIRKIDSFKCQVEECCAALRGNFNQPKPWKYKLKNSKTEINSTVNCQPIEFEYKENFVSSDIVLEHVITEIKVEHDSDFDCDPDLPLAQIKQVKELRNADGNRNKKQKVEVKKRSLTHEKYEGKIKTITISWEKMMEERKTDALRKSYLNLPFKCESCIVGFDHEKTLKVHIEQRHSDKKGAFVCDVCKSVLSTETSYKEHRKRHLRRYECEVCGKRNNNVYSVVKHYKEQHGTINTLFTCKECGFTTESHRGYRYHRDKHKGKVECTECGNTFVHATGLRVHMFTVHGQSDRVYSCDECGKRYRSKSSLATHRSVHNTSASPETFCALCNTQFRSPLGLKHHLKTHSKHIRDSDKRFICECGTKFLTKSSLKEHIDWVHLKKAKHECNKCDKVFKNGSALKKHKNYVHEKKRPPRNKICDYCGRGFTTLTILRSHVRTHTGERPLRCSQCSAAFAHPAALYTHTKLLHNKDK